MFVLCLCCALLFGTNAPTCCFPASFLPRLIFSLCPDETGLRSGYSIWHQPPGESQDPSGSAVSPTTGRAFTVTNLTDSAKFCLGGADTIVASDYALLEIEFRTNGGDLGCYPEWVDGGGTYRRPSATTIWCMHGTESYEAPVGWYVGIYCSRLFWGESKGGGSNDDG